MSMASMIFSFCSTCVRKSHCARRKESFYSEKVSEELALKEGDETYLHDLFKAAVQEIMNIGTL